MSRRESRRESHVRHDTTRHLLPYMLKTTSSSSTTVAERPKTMNTTPDQPPPNLSPSVKAPAGNPAHPSTPKPPVHPVTYTTVIPCTHHLAPTTNPLRGTHDDPPHPHRPRHRRGDSLYPHRARPLARLAPPRPHRRRGLRQPTPHPSPARRRHPEPPTTEVAPAPTVWDNLAWCESGEDWAINTGNGFYGGLQFTRDVWNAYGGQEFASLASQATRDQQILVAERIVDDVGWGAWPTCSRRLGLR